MFVITFIDSRLLIYREEITIPSLSESRPTTHIGYKAERAYAP